MGGIPVSLLIHPDGTDAVPSKEGKEVTDPVDIFLTLNALARKHGIGRIDIVENRMSESEALYDAEQVSMDSVTNFDPSATTGFIAIESIRLRKWGEARLANGGTVKPESVYAAPTQL